MRSEARSKIFKFLHFDYRYCVYDGLLLWHYVNLHNETVEVVVLAV
jgi:hypothetical protein